MLLPGRFQTPLPPGRRSEAAASCPTDESYCLSVFPEVLDPERDGVPRVWEDAPAGIKMPSSL